MKFRFVLPLSDTDLQAQIIEPTHALFLIDGYTGRVDLTFEGRGSLKLIPRPELISR